MIILDSLLMGGLRFVLEKLAAAVEAELDDDGVLREELLAAQMRLELGEIDDTEFRRIEADLLERIGEIRERRRGEETPRGSLRVTGAEVTFEGEESEHRDDGGKTRARRRR
ncbi:MAG TPA: gas vesicle protein GvpG [Candidatus Nitrosocosmicus sp.]|nr:gas vesicle protein GvpG [Candidatus Nitrosocosmicus sp.]